MHQLRTPLPSTYCIVYSANCILHTFYLHCIQLNVYFSPLIEYCLPPTCYTVSFLQLTACCHLLTAYFSAYDHCLLPSLLTTYTAYCSASEKVVRPLTQSHRQISLFIPLSIFKILIDWFLFRFGICQSKRNL